MLDGSAPLLSLSILLTSSSCFFSSCVVKSLHLVSPPVLMICDAEHPLNRIAAIAIAAGAIAFIFGALSWYEVASLCTPLRRISNLVAAVRVVVSGSGWVRAQVGPDRAPRRAG